MGAQVGDDLAKFVRTEGFHPLVLEDFQTDVGKGAAGVLRIGLDTDLAGQGTNFLGAVLGTPHRQGCRDGWTDVVAQVFQSRPLPDVVCVISDAAEGAPREEWAPGLFVSLRDDQGPLGLDSEFLREQGA